MKLSLVPKTVLITSVITSVLLISFGVYEYQIQSVESHGQLNTKAQLVMTRVVNSAGPAVWAMDNPQLKAILNAEMGDPDISSAMIFQGEAAKKELLLSADRDASGKAFFATNTVVPTTLTQTRDIIYNDKPIGAVVVNLSDAALKQKLRSMLVSKAVETIGLNTCIIIVLLVTMRSKLVRPLKAVISKLHSGACVVNDSCSIITVSNQALAEGASEQAASQEETSASLEEISAMTKSNADYAKKAKELTASARVVADNGTADMNAMAAAMDAIKLSSGNIAKIIKTIDEIAFQTNILALNAAVEAARAGEAGMGFAVVAEEVRNLAQRCSNAARETSEKIEDSIQKSENGVLLNTKVGASLKELADRTRQVDELVVQIANATDEQSRGVEQVNAAVAQMSQVTQSNAARTEESASASSELKSQADSLGGIVGQLLNLLGEEAKNIHQNQNERAQRQTTVDTSPAPRRAKPGQASQRSRGAHC